MAERADPEVPRIGVVCEARADFELGTCLADRVVCARLDWLTPELLNHCRQWCGVRPEALAERYLCWKDVEHANEQRERPFRLRGHFGGRPGLADARRARLAITLFHALDVRVVVLLRDADHQASERRGGLEQARAAAPPGMTVVIGLAEAKRESWVLSGFAAETADERTTLGELQRELGYDPTRSPERLTAGDRGTHSAKPVLERLTGGDPERERPCWEETPLDVLETRGQGNGLASYLCELSERLAPWFETGSGAD